MTYLWEAMLRAKEQNISADSLRFSMAGRFSGYMELSNPCLNEQDLRGIHPVEVNLYYRFYHIFKDLCHPEQREFPHLTAGLVNMAVHLLAENDVLSGMTRKEYYKELLYQDIKEGLFGPEILEGIRLFDRDGRETILSGLLRQYETGSSLDIFKDMVEDLIEESIVYRSNDNFHEILVYVGQKEGEKIQGKMELLLRLFVELPYHVEIYYERHFGIMGVDCTMELDAMTLC